MTDVDHRQAAIDAVVQAQKDFTPCFDHPDRMREARAHRYVDAAAPHLAAAERERIQQRFSEWIDAVASSPPEPGPPELWKAAFASLIDPDHPGKIIRQEAAGAP